jgi:hypothetical protein
MESLAWLLVGVAAITGTLAIAMIISYMAQTRATRYTDICDCGCEQSLPLDICSSECDELCRDLNHYEGEGWRCHY